MVYFVGAGPGAEDLITVRGQKLLQEADVVIWAGSLVNPRLLDVCKPSCEIHDSAKLTLEDVFAITKAAHDEGKMVVRLHTGDPSIYGAIREQMDLLAEAGIPFEVVPGVSSFCGTAAALKAELTLPNVSQTVIITRLEGHTPMPEGEKMRDLAAHGATMCIFLSSGMLEKLAGELIAGGYAPDTPAALVYKATWPEEKVCRCTIETLAQTGAENNIKATAMVVIGGVLGDEYERSYLYHGGFTTWFREGDGSLGSSRED